MKAQNWPSPTRTTGSNRASRNRRRIRQQLVLPLDVTDDTQIAACFEQLGHTGTGFDILVHAIAFARAKPSPVVPGGMTRENSPWPTTFRPTRCGPGESTRPAMQGRDGAVLTLTTCGAVRALQQLQRHGRGQASTGGDGPLPGAEPGPEGIRVNAISAGPLRPSPPLALAVSAASWTRGSVFAMRRTVTIEDVGNVGAFLCSDLAAGVTGEVTYVDAGYNILGMTGIGED